MSSSWSDDLPDEILFLIVKRLSDGSDFMSFSQVCSSWRSLAEQDRKRFRPALPGVLTKRIFTKQESLSGILTKQECPRKLKFWPSPSLPKENVVCGSHLGWVVMRESNSYEELVLINPVTQVRFKLPFPFKLPFSSSYATRIIFSANPMDYNCYYIIPHPFRYCKLGDMQWTHDMEWNAPFGFVGFLDAIYYRGKLYTLRVTGELFVCHDITASPPMMTKLVNTPHYWPVNRASLDESLGRFFLVESGQELLLVYRKEKYVLFEGLEVYRLDMGGLRWGRVRNLGEHALFLGKTQSFSLSELDVTGIKGNHIYYMEEGSCSVSVFSLENSRVEFELLRGKSLGFWFMPQRFS